LQYELGKVDELDGIAELLPGTALDELGVAEEELFNSGRTDELELYGQTLLNTPPPGQSL